MKIISVLSGVKKLSRWIFLITLIISLLLSGCSPNLGQVKAQTVSFSEVLSNPQKYDYQVITIEGYFSSGWEWFGMSENYTYENQRGIRLTGGSIIIGGDPKNIKVSEKERNQVGQVLSHAFVNNYATDSYFAKVRITGEFQFHGGRPQIVPIAAELLPWQPPDSSAAPVAQGVLTLSKSPALGKPVEVIYTFCLAENSGLDSAEATATVRLSALFELIDGNLQWKGILNKGEKVKLKATVKAVQKGTGWFVAGVSFSPFAGGVSNSKSQNLYVLVLNDRGFFSTRQADLPFEGTGTPYPTPAATSDDVVISLDLSLPKPPALGKTAEITLTATAVLEAPGARIDIQLPKGLSLVSGNLTWEGNMTTGESVKLQAVIKPTEIGKFTIWGTGQYSPTPSYSKVGPAYIMTLYVFKDGAGTLETPPPAPLPKLSVDLSLSSLPALHQQAELTWKIVALNGDLPKARAEILLRTIEFKVSGTPSWEGELKQGIPVEVKVQIEPIITGVLTLRADVSYWNGGGWAGFIGADKWLYLQVTENSAVFVPNLPNPPITPSPVVPNPNR